MDKNIVLPKVVTFDYNKHLPQSSSDKTSDLFFILATLYMANDEEKELTKLTLEKILFQSTQELANKNNYLFLNTFFYINKFGPHNNMFYKYLQELQMGDLIELNGNNVYLTLKGVNLFSEIIGDLKANSDLLTILVSLKKFIEMYSGNDSTRAVAETHSLMVKDTTDKNKIKTVQNIIDEIKPDQQFKSGSDFKYIEPFVKSKSKKITIPPKVVNRLEAVIADIKSEDFKTEAEINNLFA